MNQENYNICYREYKGGHILIFRSSGSELYCFADMERQCGSSCPHFNITRCNFDDSDDKITIRLSCTGCGLTIVAGKANF